MGLVGIFLWSLVVLGVIAGFSVSRQTLELRVFLSLLVCYLAAAIGTEVFQTTRPGLAFWMVSGILFSQRASIDESGLRGG